MIHVDRKEFKGILLIMIVSKLLKLIFVHRYKQLPAGCLGSPAEDPTPDYTPAWCLPCYDRHPRKWSNLSGSCRSRSAGRLLLYRLLTFGKPGHPSTHMSRLSRGEPSKMIQDRVRGHAHSSHEVCPQRWTGVSPMHAWVQNASLDVYLTVIGAFIWSGDSGTVWRSAIQMSTRELRRCGYNT